MSLSVSHIGICVSDLAGSLRFYRDGLGFEEVAAHEVGDEFAALMEIDGVRLRSRMVRRDGVTLELLAFDAPGTTGDPCRRPMNRLGFTHLSLRVDDLEAVAETIGAFGGSVVSSTRTTLALGGTRLDFLYCTDPDGVRIELMDLGAGPRPLPGGSDPLVP